MRIEQKLNNPLSLKDPALTQSAILNSLSSLFFAIALLGLAGCGGMSTRETSPPVARAPDGTPAPTTTTPAKPPVSRGGGYYLNDGPGDNPPPNLDQVADAVPKREPLARGAMRPYTVMGQNYTPMTQVTPYKARGIASWYGRRYHGQQTSSGEIYDMYGMTAAHTVLPIPSFARVTNVANNKSIVVRINDRGPFYPDRLIDLSYTAAYKLGVLGGGKAIVEVETIIVDAGTPTPPTLATAPADTPPVSATTTATPLTPAAAPAGTPLADVTPPPAAANPASPQAVAPETAIVAVTAEQKGLFLQLAAFGSRENADIYLARLRTQVDWLAPALHVYPKDGFFRVHAGPYTTQADARAAADRIGQSLGIKAMVLTR
ncbi:MAG: Endolytic peptidoglycan transglycosylase RlpA [Betaproteobacteria bacterium]|nr:Endolytic peptidoglycan transglycosylase RlpA [Betaproteobacteria bacterium]